MADPGLWDAGDYLLIRRPLTASGHGCLGEGGGTSGTAQPVTPALYLYFLALDAAGYALVRYKRWTWFGAVLLVAAFLTPLIVASGARPNPSAALA